MKARTFRKTVKNLRLFWMSDWFSLVISAPVSTSVSVVLPRLDSMRSASSSSLTEPSPVDQDGVDQAGLAHELLRRSGRSKSAKVAPPGESASPKLAMPDEGELPGAGGRRRS